MTAATPRKSPVLAGILSALLPGLGQIYAGDWRRGLTLLVSLPAQAAIFDGLGLLATCSHSIVTGVLICRPQLLGLVVLLVWAWNVWDAARMAQGKPLSAAGPILIILAANLFAAWKVTDIHAPKLQAEQRSVIAQVFSGLARPNFAERGVTEETATAKFLVPGPGAPESIAQKPRIPGQPWLVVEPEKVTEDQRLAIHGQGFTPNQPGSLILLGADEIPVADFRVNPKGRFTVIFKNPRYIPGDYFVQARVRAHTGGWRLSDTLREAAPLMLETIYLALIGTALSIIFAIPLSFLGARNLMSGSPLLKTIYGLTRGLFTILRSVEVLIFAVIAVAAVGIGPFAGVIALAIHGIGAVGKLYSEAIESIEHGPIEAIRSTGANELQVVTYAVVPQVVPQFIAFTLYRWDINVRMATVIGLVGGGGIGYQLIQYMNLLQWRQAATAIWLIAGVVMLMDYASAVIRERIG